MAAPTNPRIEELKARVRVDPKSRHFYPLAEELRRAGRFEEAEQVLRDGLTAHPTYLSAWIVLGRVLKETGKLDASRDALAHALTLDQGNVVAARLAADVYMLLGEKVEAIKKFKLVHALMPGDQEVEAIIAGLERELQPPAPASVETSAPEEETLPSDEMAAAPVPSVAIEEADARVAFEPAVSEPVTSVEDAAVASAPFDMSPEPREGPLQSEGLADASVLPASGGVFEEEPAMSATGELPAGDADEWPEETAEPGAPAEVIATVTMGDLYLSQGHPEAAGEMYRKVLEREPSNDAAREKLAQLTEEEETPGDPRQRKIAALRVWLQKVSAQ